MVADSRSEPGSAPQPFSERAESERRSDSPADPAGGRGPALFPLALFTCAVLALEVFLARLLAYVVNTFLIYVVLGIAMTGFGASGSLVALKTSWLGKERVGGALAAWALAFVVSVVVCYATFVRLAPALPLGLGFTTFAIAGLLTLPFLAAGVVVTLALASAGKKLGAVYAADLAGSALGCFLPLYALGPLDGSRFIGLVALLGALAAWLFVRHVQPIGRALRVATLLGLGLALTAFIGSARCFPIAADPFGQVSMIKHLSEQRGFSVSKLFDRWNMTGRVEIFEYRNVPGENDPYPYRFYAQDNTAGALMAQWDGRLREEAPPGRIDSSAVASMCSDTLFGQAYFKPRARVMVIGVGGGADVQCALYFGAEEVDAVEINPATVGALRGPLNSFLGGIGSNPRVRYYVVDGRSFARAAKRGGYQLIQLSGVDTKSVMATGALALSENHLYTREAFVDYLESLEPGGALSVIRFGEREALRLVLTGVAALRELGEKEPARHVLVAKNGPVYGVIVTKSALSTEALAGYEEQLWFADRPFRGLSVVFLDNLGYRAYERAELVYRPGDARDVNFQLYFAALAAGQERAFRSGYPFDVAPVTDDRPFFFDATRYDLPDAYRAPHVIVLGSLLGSVLLLALLVIVVPLLRIRSGLKGIRALAAPAYFAGVGLSYLLIEIWLLHRFSMFLGHQAYAMSVVLATLLGSTGAGALLGARFGMAPAQRAIVGVMGIAAWLIAGRLFLPFALDAVWATSLILRVLVVGAFVLPLGLLMGLPFPAGIDWLERERPAAVAWCVGINFFCSVVASVAAIPIAMLSGYERVLNTGLVCYGLCLLAVPLMREKPVPAG